MATERPLNKLPIECCKRMVAFASPGTVASLARLSKAAYKYFNASLYERIEGCNFAGRLFMTLANGRPIKIGPHPALLVRHMEFAFTVSPYEYGDPPEKSRKKEDERRRFIACLIQALHNTARLAPGGRSQLKSFCLDANVAVEEIGPLFIKGVRFPNLKRFKIVPDRDTKPRETFQARLYQNISFTI